jgi:hypothetical protein
MPTNRRAALLVLTWMFAVAAAVLPSAQQPQSPPPGRGEAPPLPGVAARPPVRPSHAESLFTPGENCVACHNNLVSPLGEDVSIGTSWRSTMMANSARDPYWQASVRRETIDHPERGAAIQDECAACHMPMLQKIARAAGTKADVFAQLPIGKNRSELHKLAADGVSCTVCHQISDEGLGTRENFNANFVMRPTPPDGNRPIFGPFRIDAGRKTIMRSVTGFVQAEAAHIRQSELCATCHTLYTEVMSPAGQVIGSFPEQMNYQEWRHSAFSEGPNAQSCQACHMPQVHGEARVASVLGDARDGLHRHQFVGGNAFVVRMLNRYRADLGVTALPSELETTAAATIRQLQHDTATVSIARTELTGATLTVDVDVRNLTGHKFPTGYPSRRTWLHLTVRDGAGRAVFESGAVTEAGLIQGNDNDADASKYEPHYDRITSPDQVQIYEPILGDAANRPTTGLLHATHYLKDNRLLPRGFDKATADKDIAVYGDAFTDASFTSEGDRVRYAVDVPAGGGPFAVEIELLYQPIGFRWAHNLDPYDAPEPKRFVGYFNAMSPASWVVVAHAASAP